MEKPLLEVKDLSVSIKKDRKDIPIVKNMGLITLRRKSLSNPLFFIIIFSLNAREWQR